MARVSQAKHVRFGRFGSGLSDEAFSKCTDYFVDGQLVPMAGIGSLVTFQSLLPGVLQSASTTIKAAWDVQKGSAHSVWGWCVIEGLLCATCS